MKTRPLDFLRFPSQSGQLATHHDQYAFTTVFRWTAEAAYREEACESDAALFGYVLCGTTTLRTATSEYILAEGQFFSVAPPCSMAGGMGMLVRHGNFRPLPHVGGPIEDQGRLQYISGCTDTLLVPPLRRGDPCLNALYFPPNTSQQPHTHPSVRVGMVASGHGEAVLPNHLQPLHLGDVFVISPNAVHSFRTPPETQMTVIAYHPDSDFGPEDDDHPMINRTVVAGVSAGRSGLAHRGHRAAPKPAAD